MVGKTDVKKLWEQVRHYPNVVGYAPVLKPPMRNKRVRRGGWSFRVFVSKKYTEDLLGVDDILPESIDSIRVDVVEFGDYFKDEIRMSGEYILIEDAYVGESCFLLVSSS